MENPKRRSQWWTWWFKWWIIAAAFVLVILIHSEPPQLWFWLVTFLALILYETSCINPKTNDRNNNGRDFQLIIY